MSRAAEAARQQALVAAIAAPPADLRALGLRGPDERAARGLAAYRGNAAAVAERALRAAFPTVAAMLGDDDFHPLAREFWRAEPPTRGDLGEWGEALPGWIGAHAGLRDWPWLGDCARLDWAVHRCERAADASFDAPSLALLERCDPAAIIAVPMPGTALVVAPYPVVTIHAAHRDGGPGFEVVRAALRAGRGEAALVARDGWRAAVHTVDGAGAAVWRALFDGRDLGTALAAADDGFDFAGWLADAIRRRALQGWRRVADA